MKFSGFGAFSAVLAALLLICADDAAAEGCSRVDPDPQVPAQSPLVGGVYGSGDILVVFLHGDLSGGGPVDYTHDEAKKLSGDRPDVTAVALARPCYPDKFGRVSPGDFADRWNHYTPNHNDLLIESLRVLHTELAPTHMIVVGHSGGAAMLGVTIGRSQVPIDVAILVACPCNIPEWRPGWTKSESPHSFAKGVRHETRVTAVNGLKDYNTIPKLALDYLRLLNDDVHRKYVPVPEAGHRYGLLAAPVRREIDLSIEGFD